jgi:hypothetical protein
LNGARPIETMADAKGQVHVFGQPFRGKTRSLAEKWTSPLDFVVPLSLSPTADGPAGSRGFGRRVGVLARATAGDDRPRLILGIRVVAQRPRLLHRSAARMQPTGATYPRAAGNGRQQEDDEKRAEPPHVGGIIGTPGL